MPRPWLIFVCVLLLGTALFAQETRWITVYAPQANYQVDIVEREGADYVGLTDLMEPLGRLETRVDAGKLTLVFNGHSAEFLEGRRQYTTGNSGRLELGTNFAIVDGRGYVPLASVPQLLYRLAGQSAELHISSRRLFIGGAQMHFTAELRHAPTRLVFTFPAPVNPSTVIERNRVRLFFRREAVVGSNADNISYRDPFVLSTVYTESAEGAEITVNVAQPGKVTLGEGNRSVIIAQAAPDAPPPPVTAPAPATAKSPARPAAPAATSPAASPAAPPASQAAPAPVAEQAAPAPERGRPFVVLDAAHGGQDTGVLLTDSLVEKHFTLAVAQKMQKELEAHGVKVLLIRPADESPNWNQRAQAANIAHATLYISLHGSTMGHGVRIYTAVIPGAQPGPNARGFLPWEAAQVPFLAQSRLAAEGLSAECNSRHLPVRLSAAPLRPLNSVTSAAVAVELAPLGSSPNEMGTEAYQKKVASALAAGVLALHGRLEVAP
jgi:N-acetylmuramoyl-L-alanine amidase